MQIPHYDTVLDGLLLCDLQALVMSFAHSAPRPATSEGKRGEVPLGPVRPGTTGSVASSRSSVRSTLATYKHASRVSGKTPKELLSQSDAAAARRMAVGKNHTYRRLRRDFLPPVPEAKNASQKPRTTRAQARATMA